MNKNPIMVFTGLAVAAIAGVAGLTRDRWMQPLTAMQPVTTAEAPAKPVEQAAAPAVTTPAEAPAKPVEQAAAPAVEQPAVTAEAPAKPVEQAAAPAVTAEAPAKPAEQAAAPAVEPPAVIAEAAAKPVEQAAAPAVEPPAVEKPATATVPTFDTVRVEKTGEAVIAGRAEAGSEVVVKLDGHAIGTATANQDGSFVVVPEQPLPVGSGALTIEAKTDKQPIATASEQTVAVIVQGEGKQGALVAVVSPDAPTKVLQTPEPEKTTEQQVASAAPVEPPVAEPPAAEQPAATVPAVTQPAAEQPAAELPAAEQPAATQPAAAVTAKPRLVSLDAVDYDPTGNIVFSGQGQKGTGARLYVDNALVGDAAVGADGRWTFSGTTSVAAGVHALRVDGVGADGKVINRIEVPFFREETTKVAAAAPASEAPAAEPPAAKTDVQIATGEPVAPATQPPAAVVPAKPKDGRVVIQPGNNLWRISKVIYGSGIKYTLLYEANKDQIRDADMIYPGQVFKTPDVVPPETIDPKQRDPLIPALGEASSQ